MSDESRGGSQKGRASEDYLIPGEIARELRIHSSTVRRMFEDIDGGMFEDIDSVVRLDNRNRPQGKRRYRLMRIPRSVYRQYLQDSAKPLSGHLSVDQHTPTTVGGQSK